MALTLQGVEFMLVFYRTFRYIYLIYLITQKDSISKYWIALPVVHPCLRLANTMFHIMCLTVTFILSQCMSIEVKEGNNEEETGVVLCSSGPRVVTVYHMIT